MALMDPYKLTHLKQLEAESIHIIREVAAEFEKPVMLYSIGKDSSVMLHLALKAFYPGKPPFPLMHVDTTWKFREMIRFRDEQTKRLGLELIVHVNEDGLRQGINPFHPRLAGPYRRDENPGAEAGVGSSTASTRLLAAPAATRSARGPRSGFIPSAIRNHRWDPKNQRPELWNLYNGRVHKGESIRVFPLSNWTELDVWQYIHLENIPIVPLYLAAERPVVERDGTLIMVDDERMPLEPGETPKLEWVRFRTLGCYPLTGAVRSRPSPCRRSFRRCC
jgi:sulfate adenylyltransferase subunit 2